MRFVSEQLDDNGKPLILALGATLTEGGIKAELVYLAPITHDGPHMSIPEGPIVIQYWSTPDREPSQMLTVHWPGLVTGPGLRPRRHDNLFLRIIPEETNEQNRPEHPE